MGRVPDCLAASRLVRAEDEVTRNSRNPGTRVTRQVTEPRLTQQLRRVISYYANENIRKEENSFALCTSRSQRLVFFAKESPDLDPPKRDLPAKFQIRTCKSA